MASRYYGKNLLEAAENGRAQFDIQLRFSKGRTIVDAMEGVVGIVAAAIEGGNLRDGAGII